MRKQDIINEFERLCFNLQNLVSGTKDGEPSIGGNNIGIVKCLKQKLFEN